MAFLPSRRLGRVAAALSTCALALPAGALAVAHASSASPKAATKTVKLSGMRFSVSSLSIRKGDKVKFVWAGGAHNLVGPGVKTDVVTKGTKTLTFRKAGSFKYVCQVHAGMVVTVKVR